MIYYNSNTINDWNFGDDNIIKVYKHGAVCYYKITSGDTPTPVQEPCFAVVDDITQYTDTEFEDVYDKATEKWFKLNNLNQYEEYGIYGSGRTITYYDGKLTIDDGYEYIYSGSSWVNVGEVSGSTITIKSPEYIEKDSSHSGKINLDYVWKTNSKMQFKFYSTNNGGGGMIGEDGMPDNNDCRMFFASTTAYFDWGSIRISWSSNGRTNTLYEYEYSNYYIKNMVTSKSKTGPTILTSRTNTLYFGQGSNDRFRTYYLKFYDGDTLVKDFIPWTDMNGNYGLFDKVSLSVYNVVSGSLTGSSNVTDVEVGGGYEYPLEYPVKQDPPNNITFSSMTDAESYECPWVGMKATIDDDNYVFSGDSQSGYEWVYNPSRLPDGYTEIEYIENTSQAYINLGIDPYNATGNSFTVESTFSSYTQSNLTYLISCEYTTSPYNGFVARWNGSSIELVGNSTSVDTTAQNIPNGDGTSAITFHSDSTTTNNNNTPITLFSGLNGSSPWRYGKGRLYALKMTLNNSVVRELVPAMRDSDSKYGMYDIVNDVFYLSSNIYNFSGGNPI